MKNVSILAILLIVFSCKKDVKQVKSETQEAATIRISGNVFGTTYKTIYHSATSENYEKQFDSLFYVINKSMSTYQANSIISKINRNEPVEVDNHFIKVFNASKEIHKQTDGAFDPTIGLLVNAWNFGPEGAEKDLNKSKITDLMQSVGLDKISINKNQVSKPKGAFIDFNAIAKGYGLDVIANFLDSKNVTNYLIEIGGEIRVKGLNTDSYKPWRVGVENPNFDGTQTIMKAINLKDEAMATSGTYRKYKVDKDGNKYAHIINAKTGYPSITKLLSISVIAKDCMTADAYATAFKTMGLDKTKAFLKAHQELKAFLIFENDKKELETLSVNGFPGN